MGDSHSLFRAVCMWDAGIDLAASDMMAYAETRDLAKLEMRKDPRPTIYHLRPISNRMAITHLLGQTNDHVRRYAAFRASVVRIENVRGDAFQSPEFQPAILASLGMEGIEDRFELLSDAEMGLFDVATIMEIGEVALGRAFLPKGIAGGYLLPPTSRRLLLVMKDLYAAVCRPASDGPSGKAPPETPDGTATPSESAGDATAKGSSQRIADLVTSSALAEQT